MTVPQVEIKTIPNEQSIASALQANSVQIGLMTQPQVTEHLPSSITVQKVLDLSYRALMLQDKTGPLANVYNRLAMACALNRQAVADERRARSGEGHRPGAARPVRLEARSRPSARRQNISRRRRISRRPATRADSRSPR